MSIRNVRVDVLLVMGGLLLFATLQRPVAALQESKPQRWEYKSIIEISANDFAIADAGLVNQAGNLGWELVSVIDGPSPKARQFILKRAKQ
jgi:hypothetical protein